MAFLAPADQPALGGVVEADKTYFRRSFKGSNLTGRRARKRGTKNGRPADFARHIAVRTCGGCQRCGYRTENSEDASDGGDFVA